MPLAGSGAEGDPYRVGTTAEFALLSWHTALLDAHIVLTGDIDYAGVALHPIGDLVPFRGVFDGQGHAVHNAAIDLPTNNFTGLFSILAAEGEIWNMGVEAVDIVGKGGVGGLVGWNWHGITNCHAAGEVHSTVNQGGELVGRNHGLVSDSSSSATVSDVAAIGGLVGEAGGGDVVTGSHATGSVTGIRFVGGLIGLVNQNGGTVSGSYATGAVSGAQYVGGLVGRLGAGPGMVTDCYAIGNVDGCRRRRCCRFREWAQNASGAAIASTTRLN